MLKQKLEYLLWILRGRPVPASGTIKRIILQNYANERNLKYFVETGTFNGDTVEAMRPSMALIHSIELSKELFDKARKRFEKFPSIKLWQGDSGKVLKKILPTIKKPTLFWLDAHGSGGITAEGEEWSPIIKELILITSLSKSKHVILIDDARGFTGNQSPTIEMIESVIKKYHPKYEFVVQDDIIRIILK